MEVEKAIEMMKATLDCIKRDTSGIYEDCNRYKCDTCELNYKQGTFREKREWIQMALDLLESSKKSD